MPAGMCAWVRACRMCVHVSLPARACRFARSHDGGTILSHHSQAACPITTSLSDESPSLQRLMHEAPAPSLRAALIGLQAWRRLQAVGD